MPELSKKPLKNLFKKLPKLPLKKIQMPKLSKKPLKNLFKKLPKLPLKKIKKIILWIVCICVIIFILKVVFFALYVKKNVQAVLNVADGEDIPEI